MRVAGISPLSQGILPPTYETVFPGVSTTAPGPAHLTPPRRLDGNQVSDMQRWANDAASRTRDRRVDFDNEVETRHITPSTETLSLGSDIVIDRPSVRQSSLEAMKIAKRRRPKDRFDGITKGIDFNDHMRQFLQTVCTPNLASTERLTEQNVLLLR